jgi:hypothetical protein
MPICVCFAMGSSFQTFKIMLWNVRGIGDLDKCDVVRDAIMTAAPSIVCLQETKLQDVTEFSAKRFLPPSLDSLHFISATNSRGGILVAWSSSIFSSSPSNPSLPDAIPSPPCCPPRLPPNTSLSPMCMPRLTTEIHLFSSTISKNYYNTFPAPGVTESPKIIPCYRLSLSTWPLSNNKELLCRFCWVKTGESLTTGSRYAPSPHEGGTRVQHYITQKVHKFNST